MHRVALFGAGKIGGAIAALLGSSGRYEVRVCDVNKKSLDNIVSGLSNVSGHVLNLDDERSTLSLLEGCDALLVALPYYLNTKAASYALRANIHYFDLTEDVGSTAEVIELSQQGQKVFAPQCGLAPGFISIVSAFLIDTFDQVDSVKMRVGALPIYPSNRLKYNLSWSTEGLINEYCNLCEVIREGKRQHVPALAGHETFFLDGDEYEAFNTSGGLGTLCATLEGKVNNLDYKSVRYKGHRDLMAFLLQDLKFKDDRPSLISVLEKSISSTLQDKCLIFVEATGKDSGRLLQRTYASTVYNTRVGERHFGAIQITTAAGICAPLDLLLEGKLALKRGLLKAENIPLKLFLENDFGKYYRDEKALSGLEAI
jgi:saccharopine dehydrogenase-like NADP-dependent oxidoreductase